MSFNYKTNFETGIRSLQEWIHGIWKYGGRSRRSGCGLPKETVAIYKLVKAGEIEEGGVAFTRRYRVREQAAFYNNPLITYE